MDLGHCSNGYSIASICRPEWDVPNSSLTAETAYFTTPSKTELAEIGQFCLSEDHENEAKEQSY
jgi:hypothetical protein